MSPDPRAAVEYRVPAVDLRVGDLVNTSPGEDDWQQVIGVYRSPADVGSDQAELGALAETLGGRYVIVQLTDLSPVDTGIYFDENGVAMTYGTDGADQAVADVASADNGMRTYLYTRFELVAVRAPSV